MAETKPTELTVDVLTGESSISELTQSQVADLSSQVLAATQALEAKAEARTSALAKLAALGLTEEEIAAL
jgi:DNA-binding NarL/FixJ family response regulator